jgi:hypothetical protein
MGNWTFCRMSEELAYISITNFTNKVHVKNLQKYSDKVGSNLENKENKRKNNNVVCWGLCTVTTRY